MDHENWDIELTLDRSRTPIIKVKHRLTGLQCDISFTNGLAMENSKLIRFERTSIIYIVVFIKSFMKYISKMFKKIQVFQYGISAMPKIDAVSEKVDLADEFDWS